MVEIFEVDIKDKIPKYGNLQFTKIQWWKESPKMFLFRYSLDDEEYHLGARMDVDKRCFLDDFDHPMNDTIKADASLIWNHIFEDIVS